MNEPLRILHVVTMMNIGGLETMIMNHYRKIDRTKFQFDFLVHREGKHDYTDEILQLGGKIYSVPPVNPLNTNGYLTKLDDFFSKHSYQIVHSHIDSMSAYPLKYAKKYGVPVRIAHAHSANQDMNWKYLIKIIAKRNITRYATKLFACGEKAGKWMFKTAEFTIINNAINIEKFSFNPINRKSIREKYGIEDEFVIGQIGRFTDTKNHQFTIKVFNEVLKINPQTVLMFIGDGVLKKEIQQYAISLGIEKKIIFVGNIFNVDEYLSALDLFVMPSKYEGVPLVLIEAQSNGLQCLASKKVSLEAAVTKNVKFLPLKKEFWIKEISKCINYTERTFNLESIRKYGYDISENVKKLEEIYYG